MDPYGDDPEAQPGVAIPLGPLRRYILIGIGTIFLLIGLVTTFLFQRISYKDNNLRQRGRYLVTLQGFIGTIFVTIVMFYQAFKYRFPCALIFWVSNWGIIPFILIFLARGWRLITRFDRNIAIHQSRFAEPSDLAALELESNNLTEDKEASILITTWRPTRRSSVTNSSDDTSISLSNLQPNHGLSKDKAFELTQRTPKETARLKKWHNRYRSITDKQMLCFAIFYVFVSVIVVLYFQFHDKDLSLNPVHYDCHSGKKFNMIYFTVIVFMFVLAPFLIFQLRHTNDGFGIRTELILTSLISVPCTVFYFLVPEVAPEFTRKVFDKSNFMVLLILVSHVTSTIIPLIRHYRSHIPHKPSIPERLDRRTTSYKSNRNKRNQSKFSSSAAAAALGENRDISRNVGGVGYQGWPNSDSMTTTNDQGGIFVGDETLTEGMDTMTKHEGGGDINGGAGVGEGGGGGVGFQPRSSGRASSIQISIKSIIKNQQKDGRLRFGRTLSQGNIINNKKVDWDEFIAVLENRELFRKMSAFTVREFCAENTRFLYEVSRLERRAVQYELLRDMASDADNNASLHQYQYQQQQQQQQQQQDTIESESGLQSPTTTVFNDNLESSSAGSRISVIAPLPSHFSSAARGTGFNETPRYRIKKIVSASSMSSTAPMISLRTYTNSHDIDGGYSEPSSPLSSHSSVFRNRRNSSALIDLESGTNVNDTLPSSPTTNTTSTATTTIHNNNNNNNNGDNEELTSGEINALSNSLKTFAPLPMPPTLLIQFKYIYKTFIETGARLELNLSHDTLQEIHQIAKNGDWGSGVFDNAIFEVQELLFRDVWPKFVTSSQGLNFNGSSNPGSSAASEHGLTRGGEGRGGGGGEGRGGEGEGEGGDIPVLRTASHVSSSYQHNHHPFELPRSPTKSASGKPTSPKSSHSKVSTAEHVTMEVMNTGENSTRSSRLHKREGGMNEIEDDEEGEEVSSNAGLKTWLKSRSRKGIATVSIGSRQGDHEESVGIIEHSRKSMLARRSDTSGLYSSSIQNSLAPRK